MLIPNSYSQAKAPIQSLTEPLFSWFSILILYSPGDEYSELIPKQRTISPSVLEGTSHTQETQTGRPWLQTKVLETAELPLVERPRTTEKYLTYLPCGITRDAEAQDLSPKLCHLANNIFQPSL